MAQGSNEDLQPAVQLAVDWDPIGVVGCVAKLLMDWPPAFGKTTVATFRQACLAIHEAGLAGDMKSTLSKHTAQFIFGGLHPTAKPQAADDRIIAAALAVRLSLTLEDDSAPDTSTLVHDGVDYQAEAYKRCNQFLRVKLVVLPKWFLDWQTRIDAAKEKDEKEKAAAKKAENEKAATIAAEKAKHEGSAHSDGDGPASSTVEPDGPATSGVGLDATLAPGRGLTDLDVNEFRNAAKELSVAKKDAKKESRTDFEVGDDVLVQPKKKNDPKLKGRISRVNTKECWVEFDKSAPVTNNPGKYATYKLEFAPEQEKAIVQPATDAAACNAALNSSEAPVIEKVEELNDGDGNGGAGGSAVPTASAASAGTTGCENCTNIFCD